MSLTANFSSRIERSDSFPFEKFDLGKDLLIVDKRVAELIPDLRQLWNYIYEVDAGEELKSLEQFPSHMQAILQRWQAPISRSSRIVACGGGSIGDFSGFVASVLKRGVVLEHIPSTWLAAIDSSHGGKTALNVGGTKNQIGTFYPARAVYLVKDLLFAQPEERARDGLGELFKMALLTSELPMEALARAEGTSAQVIWDHLEKAIEGKYKVVLQDPYELTGLRKILNLGHTLGHALEAHSGRSHGECVTQGLWFAVEWSAQKRMLAAAAKASVLGAMNALGLNSWLQNSDFIPMESKKAQDLVGKDKKLTADGKVDFVFLRDIGKPAVQAVTVQDILTEAQRQGWVRG